MTNNKFINSEFDIYLENVNDPQDLILFEDAVKSANLGMYRSAYILVWLCCVEALKRRFKECGKYDKQANDIYSQIINLEKQHKAVDESILKSLKNYGFISDFEFTKLNQLYAHRCVYAHPYKEAPSKENVLSAISDIVNIVLLKPTMLSEDYIDRLLNKLSNDINYLNDYDITVKNETQNWLDKINSIYYSYFIEKYCDIAEIYSKDNTKEIFVRRAKWVIEEILKTRYNIYTNEEWHDFIIKYPNFAIRLAKNNKDFFLNIGERAQDYLISKILEFANNKPEYLQILTPYLEDKDILRDNYNRIISRINNLSLDAIKSSGLVFTYWIDAILKELESGDYYRQNPTITLIQENEQSIVTLDANKQFKLGELIHRAACNNAWYAKDYISKIISNSNDFPVEFLRGICSIIIEDYPARKYVYLREGLLQPINLLIQNLENNREIINYVNSLLSRYAMCEIAEGNYTLEEIQNHIQINRYDWIELNLQGNEN